MANQTVTVLEADGTTETDLEVLGFGRQAAAASKSTAMSTEDKAVLDAAAASLVSILAKIIASPATEAKQDTMITSLQALDNAISGSEFQVDVVAALPAGTNNIGDVDVLTLPSLPAGTNNIGDVDVLSLPATPAGTNLIGRVSASPETSTIYNGTTALTPKFAKVSCSASGNNEIVAAVSAKKIRVIAWDISPSDVVNFKWRTASTDLSGLYYAANAGNGVARAWNPVGYFETVANEALNLNLSGSVAVGGSIVYVEV
jgi:hypothetical protein